MSSLDTLIDTDADRGNPLLGKAWHDEDEYDFDPGEIAAVERMSYEDRRAVRAQLKLSRVAPYVSAASGAKIESLKRLVAVIDYVEHLERDRAAREDNESLELSGFDSQTGQPYDDRSDEEDDFGDGGDRMDWNYRAAKAGREEEQRAEEDAWDERAQNMLDAEDAFDDEWIAVQEELEAGGRQRSRPSVTKPTRLIIFRDLEGNEVRQECKLSHAVNATNAFYKGIWNSVLLSEETVHFEVRVTLGHNRVLRCYMTSTSRVKRRGDFERFIENLEQEVANYKN